MAKLQFEGDISGISEQQLEFIRNVLIERGYISETVIVEAVGKDGDNYVATVKRIIVKKDDDTFKMIAKIAPTVEPLRTMMNTMIMFRNEHVMYTNVLPKFADLQEEANIPKDEKLRFPTCYGSLQEAPNEVILLEDLNTSGFTMLDKFISLDDETVKLVLKEFAKLHSLSYIFKKLEPETFAEYKSKLIDMWSAIDQVEESKFYFQQTEADMMQILDDPKYKDKLKGTVSQVTKLAIKNFKIDSQSKFSVIQHGDSWTNNVMFYLEDDKPIHCCLIDYQVSKESSPVADLHYMIFNCTDFETRAKHYYDWIDYYHKELDKSLSHYGLKSNFIYPRDQMDADLKRHAKLSFAQSVLLAGVLMRESGESAQLKEVLGKEDALEEVMNAAKISILEDKTIQRFKDRVEGLIESFISFGYL